MSDDAEGWTDEYKAHCMNQYSVPTDELRDIARRLRIESLKMVYKAKSGHCGGPLSCAGFHDSGHCHQRQHDQEGVCTNGNGSELDGDVFQHSDQQRCRPPPKAAIGPWTASERV